MLLEGGRKSAAISYGARSLSCQAELFLKKEMLVLGGLDVLALIN